MLIPRFGVSCNTQRPNPQAPFRHPGDQWQQSLQIFNRSQVTKDEVGIVGGVMGKKGGGSPKTLGNLMKFERKVYLGGGFKDFLFLPRSLGK